MPPDMPIITIELQGMKQKISVAFSEYCEEIQNHVNHVLEEMTRPENLRRIIWEKMALGIDRGLNDAINKAITDALYNSEFHGQLSQMVGNLLVESGKRTAKIREQQEQERKRREAEEAEKGNAGNG